MKEHCSQRQQYYLTASRWLALSALTMVVISAESFFVKPAFTTINRGGSVRERPAFVQPGSSSFDDNDQQNFYNEQPVATATAVKGPLLAGDPAESTAPLKILFLSADTGGGHRASAESLAQQFLQHYPNSTYDLLDVWTKDGVYPYKTLVKSYKHLSAHPRQWKYLYHLSNSRLWEFCTDVHSTFMCERKIRKRIESYQPDVIVSVHPTMNYAPLKAVQRLSKMRGSHIPFFTVVTDLATGHCTWFQKNVDKIYVASERMKQLSQKRGRTPEDKITVIGLPIRHQFSIQAHNLGDRTSPAGREYQANVKRELGIDPSKPMVLLMGGGEGVGSLSKIVDQVYASLHTRAIGATLCVVCGRNEKLQSQLASRDWEGVAETLQTARRRKRRLIRLVSSRRRMRELSAISNNNNTIMLESAGSNITVAGLGFVANMADYMVAADLIVTKAGPGTIAEAAALGLPVLLTSFLPGQEAGNKDFVLENNFGDYMTDPKEIGEKAADWLDNPLMLEQLSQHARIVGHPDAASDIVKDIGSLSHTWMALNTYKREGEELTDDDDDNSTVPSVATSSSINGS